jgi:hypothetical protein
MIGKVITGKSFGGCIRYVVQKQDATILDAAGIRIQDASQMINDFNMQRKFNPDLGKAVGHIVLSWSVNDAGKLNDATMGNLAKEYLHKMKIRDTQYLVVKHNDREHPHIHIVYNRVDNDGKTISDNFQKQRNVKVAKELTLKHGFYVAPGKDQVKRQALKGADKVKYELFDAIRSARRKVRSIDELINVLARNGITTHLKYKGDTNEVQGISFSQGDYKFKGSEIDRSLSYGKLLNAINKQQLKPEKSLADQLRETVENGRQNGFVAENKHKNQHEVSAQPDGWLNSPFIDISIADDIDDEAIHGRNRHRKKQARTNAR